MDIYKKEARIFLKFGKKENLEQLQRGRLYMSPLQKFVDLEQNDKNTVIGDIMEGEILLKNVNFSCSNKNKTLFSSNSNILCETDLNEYLSFCLMSLDRFNCPPKKNVKSYLFTFEQQQELLNFGDTVLIIRNTVSFHKKIKDSLYKLQLDNSHWAYGAVQYYKENELTPLKEIYANSIKAAYWKRKDYEYQQEYRFLFDYKSTESFCLDIGSITDISEILTAKEVLENKLLLPWL